VAASPYIRVRQSTKQVSPVSPVTPDLPTNPVSVPAILAAPTKPVFAARAKASV
jgi:hypothetical protein